jgi:hypothetical protein
MGKVTNEVGIQRDISNQSVSQEGIHSNIHTHVYSRVFLLLRRSDSECLSRFELQCEISNSGGLTCAGSAPHGTASPIPIPPVGRVKPNLRVTQRKRKDTL